MHFYVIYNFDTTKDVSILSYKPKNPALWQITEDDDNYEYDYLGPSFKNGKHRKYVGILTKEQFKEFVSHANLIYEDIDTMGSLTELGWFPAMSFHSDNGMLYTEKSGLIQASAYVTPFPEPVRSYLNPKEDSASTDESIEQTEIKTWNRLKNVMKRMFT